MIIYLLKNKLDKMSKASDRISKEQEQKKPMEK